MKKSAIILLMTGMNFYSNAQLLTGTAVASGRKITNTSDFTVYDKKEGTVNIEVAISREGKVTSAKVVGAEKISSTPSLMLAQNAAKKLLFTPGTHYAQFEHATVKFTYKVKPVVTP